MQACGGDGRKGARKEGLEVGLHHPEGAHTHTHTLTSLQPSWCGDCPASPPGRQTSTRKVPSNKGLARSKAALLLPLLPLLQLSLLLPWSIEEAKAAEGGAMCRCAPMARAGAGAGGGAGGCDLCVYVRGGGE